ncbi:cyclopropane-fatty-acyl-phospholipid synthase family protein [Amycolatopsis sp. cg5]|uniref:SAM-dependent methyltransferase n=1 Tax=Amycolatopsis sp. cg5 TaxID=3238802 RepID=UPI00352562CB
MDRDLISRIAHADHPIAAPLADDSVRALLDRAVRPGDRVLDLGCGGGEWLLRALAAEPDLRADGVDVAEPALAHARAAAEALGVHDRLTLHRQDATEFASDRPFDVVLSVGAAHVFGGLLPTLAAARKHLAPGGRVLVGDGFWEREPSAEAIEMLGDFGDLASTMDSVVADGWTPVGGHVSTRRELDDYEWAWTGSLASWALDRQDDPDGREALTVATAHRTEWLRTYRDTWGFLCLVLRRTDDGDAPR